jgi:uncharacterized protein YjiK
MSILTALLFLLPSAPPDTLPYNLNAPVLTINLVHEDLKEISALSPADSTGVFLAINDEVGEIFFVDGNGGGTIYRRVKFRDKGDFEGVEMVGKCLFAVKSDGTLFEIDNWKNPRKMKVREYKTPLKKSDDVEGLAFDTRRNALFLACKGEPDSSYVRKIFAFDMKTKTLLPEPIYTIDPLEVNKLVPNEGKDKTNFFSPSGVAIHPVTGDVYVISSSKKRLVVLDYRSGKLKMAVRLDKNILPQPEGIAFDLEGNLYIGSEGKKGEGMMLKFKYEKK